LFPRAEGGRIEVEGGAAFFVDLLFLNPPYQSSKEYGNSKADLA